MQVWLYSVRRMRRSKSVILLSAALAAVLLLTGCGHGRRNGVLSKSKMQDVLIDYHLAQGLIAELERNERYQYQEYYNYVFQKHNVSQEQFDSSLTWYARHPEELHDVYVAISEEITARKAVLADRLQKLEKKSFSISSGDSVDLWYLEHNRIMTQSPVMNTVTFSYNTDTTFYLSDTLVWQFGTSFFNTSRADSLRQYLVASISLAYADSIVSDDVIIDSDGTFRKPLVFDDSIKVSRIFGSVTYQSELPSDSAFVLLHSASLLRLHKPVAPADSTLSAETSPELGTDD